MVFIFYLLRFFNLDGYRIVVNRGDYLYRKIEVEID